jgi:hypothetical protein
MKHVDNTCTVSAVHRERGLLIGTSRIVAQDLGGLRNKKKQRLAATGPGTRGSLNEGSLGCRLAPSWHVLWPPIAFGG